jgi:hypothetical protein
MATIILLKMSMLKKVRNTIDNNFIIKIGPNIGKSLK